MRRRANLPAVDSFTVADVVQATKKLEAMSIKLDAKGMISIPIGRAATKVSRFAKLAKDFAADGLGQASSVLREVRAVPTIFPQVDQVLGVGGWPTDCFFLIHGESSGGKTEFSLGLLLSFLMRDHAAMLVDAERTTPRSWVRKLMGSYADHPGFTAMYPKSYEQTVDAVRAWAERIGDAKAHGHLDPETTGICIVDSIRKLTPKKLLERLLKESADGGSADEDGGGGRKRGARGIDGAGGRGNQIKAQINAQWVDELTVLLHETGTCLGAIARETEAPTDLSNFMQDNFKIGGGRSLFFESSVVARVTNAGGTYDDANQIISEKHAVQIRKTKVNGHLTKYPRAYFNVSTGLLTPYGFDGPRDILEIATQIGSVDQSGNAYSIGGVLIGRGENQAVKALAEKEELRERVERETREAFMPANAEEASAAPPATINRKKVSAKGKSKRKATKAKGKKR